jgi:ribosomal-protein-alanine N-acetyltransferase
LTAAYSHRPLGALDLDLASALHAEAFAPLGERGWTRREMAELLAAPGVAGLVLQSGRKEVGLALWRVAADEAELLTVAIRPDCRRRGAGRALVELVVALARERAAGSLFLEVGADNAAALALYRAMGFRQVGHRCAYYRRVDRPAADAIVMRLGLD